ncbi:MAG: outer membrane lipoprotein carrier protein LolA [Desulfobacterales bacterium]|nr:outer membrane lipoprotein carrier protein LolA [Desulfobacterales bacterium]
MLALFCVGWGDSWETLRTTAASVTSVQADFVQEKHLPILAKPLVSQGAFYYQKPGALRWEYRSPVQSIMLMHDGHTRRFVAGPSGWTEERGAGLEAMQVVMEEISQWLAGNFSDNPMFEAKLEPGRRILMIPKEEAMRQVIQRIELNLADRPGVMQSVVIYESEQAFTRMTFGHTVLNAKIDEALFRSAP